EVGVIAEREPAAGPAGAAWPLVRPGTFAQQRLRARLGEFEFTQALPALHQDRVGQALPQAGPILPRSLLPLKYHFQHSVEIISSTSFLTSGRGLPDWTTLIRRGSAAVRSRYAARTRSKNALLSSSKRSPRFFASRASATSTGASKTRVRSGCSPPC